MAIQKQIVAWFGLWAIACQPLYLGLCDRHLGRHQEELDNFPAF